MIIIIIMVIMSSLPLTGLILPKWSIPFQSPFIFLCKGQGALFHSNIWYYQLRPQVPLSFSTILRFIHTSEFFITLGIAVYSQLSYGLQAPGRSLDLCGEPHLTCPIVYKYFRLFLKTIPKYPSSSASFLLGHHHFKLLRVFQY